MKKITNAVEYIDIKKIKPLQGNPRTISKDQFDKLVESIRANEDYFEARPLILSDRTGELVVLAGNQRLRASKTIGLDQVPAVVLHGLTEEREREIIIRDNVSNGDWDMDALANDWDMADLESWGVELEFGDEPTAEDVKEVEEIQPNEEEEPESKLGEIYELGQHRLICGDSLAYDTLERLMGGQMADMLLTDPPYNVDYTGRTKDALKIQNDKMGDSQFIDFLADAFRNADAHMRPGGAFYIWHADLCRAQFCAGVEQAGWQIRQILVWIKNSFVMGRQDYQWQHEPCIYGWKDGAAHSFIDDRTIPTLLDQEKESKDMTKAELVELVDRLRKEAHSTTIREKRPTASRWHPTTKPTELMARLIMNSTKPGQAVLDIFAGSGSTLLAADQMGRTAYVCELDPKYCDVIRKRYQILKTGDQDGWQDATPAIRG